MQLQGAGGQGKQRGSALVCDVASAAAGVTLRHQGKQLVK